MARRHTNNSRINDTNEYINIAIIPIRVNTHLQTCAWNIDIERGRDTTYMNII